MVVAVEADLGSLDLRELNETLRRLQAPRTTQVGTKKMTWGVPLLCIALLDENRCDAPFLFLFVLHRRS